MLSNDEYKKRKADDMEFALELAAIIQNSKDPAVKYKDSRPIMDLKHMLETSASEEWYSDHVAFYQKMKPGAEYETVSYQQTLADVNALGTALIDAGLKGKKIAIIGENSYWWAVSYLAVVCGTGIAVPLDKELSAKDVEGLVAQAEVACAIMTDKHAKTFEPLYKSGETCLKLLVNMDADNDTTLALSWKELVAKGHRLIAEGNREFLDAQILTDEMSVLLFTSGTTGLSKGVMLSQRNLVTDLMVAPTVLKVHDWDIFFSVLPIHHTYECTCGFLMPLYKGAAIAYCEGLKHITKNLAEVRPTMFLGVPLIMESLYKKIWQNVRKKGKEDLLRKIIRINRKTKKVGVNLGNIFFKDILAVFGGRMRIMIVGGAAINPEVLEGIQDFGIQALQGYGLTECAPMAALNPDTAPNARSVGRPFPGIDLKIDNPDEEGTGEICVRGGNVMMGYYNMPEATAEVIYDGWLHTGDLGHKDDKGYYFITGRKKNVIITKNGKNVYPEELEYMINKSPFILESMVFAEESSDYEDTLIVASVVMDEEELTQAFENPLSVEERTKLVWEAVDKINDDSPFYRRIKRVILRDEELEKNTSKKIKRFAEGNRL
jgi:long-chain acyl-CoA synthetase